MLLMEVIKEIPDPPKALREAALRGTLIPFVGAGASRIAGCPNWSEFADGALRFFVEQGKFSHGQLAQISHLNPRVKLSIARGFRPSTRFPSISGKSCIPLDAKTIPRGDFSTRNSQTLNKHSSPPIPPIA